MNADPVASAALAAQLAVTAAIVPRDGRPWQRMRAYEEYLRSEDEAGVLAVLARRILETLKHHHTGEITAPLVSRSRNEVTGYSCLFADVEMLGAGPSKL